MRDGRTDGWIETNTIYPPTTLLCGGYNYAQTATNHAGPLNGLLLTPLNQLWFALSQMWWDPPKQSPSIKHRGAWGMMGLASQQLNGCCLYWNEALFFKSSTPHDNTTPSLVKPFQRIPQCTMGRCVLRKPQWEEESTKIMKYNWVNITATHFHLLKAKKIRYLG